MKISCDVIKDLLPLYAEDMVSDNTRQMIEKHLEECDDCRKSCHEMKETMCIPQKTNTFALEKLSKKMMRIGLLIAVLALSVTALLFVAGQVHSEAREYLGFGTALVSWTELEDGRLEVVLTDAVDDYEINFETVIVDGKSYSVATIYTWRYLNEDAVMRENVRTILIPAEVDFVQHGKRFGNGGGAWTFLKGERPFDGWRDQTHYTLDGFFDGSCVIALVLMFIFFCMKLSFGEVRGVKWLGYGAVLLLSFAGAIWLTTGGQRQYAVSAQEIGHIIALSVLATGALVSLFELIGMLRKK